MAVPPPRRLHQHPSFSCACRDGFTGDGATCADVDECAIPAGADDCAARSAGCQNTDGGYRCRCGAGFISQGSGSKLRCVDVNECIAGTHDCDRSLAACQNTKGAYRCRCLHNPAEICGGPGADAADEICGGPGADAADSGDAADAQPGPPLKVIDGGGARPPPPLLQAKRGRNPLAEQPAEASPMAVGPAFGPGGVQRGRPLLSDRERFLQSLK